MVKSAAGTLEAVRKLPVAAVRKQNGIVVREQIALVCCKRLMLVAQRANLPCSRSRSVLPPAERGKKSSEKCTKHALQVAQRSSRLGDGLLDRAARPRRDVSG